MTPFTDPTRLKGIRVMVVGDVMLDRYLWSEVGRISPEAPVPVAHVRERSETLGGAGNVAANLAGLECAPVVIGVIGADRAGERLDALFLKKGVERTLMVDAARPTIAKTRVMGGGQQLIRIDEETPGALTDDMAREIMTTVTALLPGCRAVVLSDYGKGVLGTPGLCRRIIDECRRASIPVLVDPKGNDWERYTGATCVTPNTMELTGVAGLEGACSEERFEAAARGVRDRYGLAWLLATRGPKGMLLVGPDNRLSPLPARTREVFDVSGAGDTVIATAAAGVAAGLAFEEAAAMANLAAGIVVGKVGTQPVTAGELRSALAMQGDVDISLPRPKTADLESAAAQAAAWRSEGRRVVFTNGCFDLLHTGHIHLLHQARSLGDRLVVGLNSDDSIRRLKGPSRPIIGEGDRLAVLGALASVDMVVLFNGDTPMSLIETLRPDVLAKGADYQMEEIVGGDAVLSYGGEVRRIPLLPGYSTTGLTERITRRP